MKHLRKVTFKTFKYVVLCLLISSLAYASSDKVGYAGRLVDTSGQPITGTPDLRFELYYTDMTGTDDWICFVELPDVPLANGAYYVELDFPAAGCDLNQVIQDIPGGESLAIRVHDLTNSLSFDFQTVGSVPMAFHSHFAEHVADGAITSEKLDQMGADSGEALIWDGSQWAPGQAGEAGTVTSVNAGDGLSVTDPENDPILNVNVDDDTIEISSDTLQVKDGGITSAKIGDGEVIASKIPFHTNHFNDNAGVLELLFSPAGGVHADPIIGLSLGVDGSTIELSGGSLQVRDGGIGNDQLTSGIDAGKLTVGILDSERLDTGTGANQVVQVGADGNLPTLDGRNLINLPAVESQDTLCADGEYLQASGGSFVCTSAGAGDGDFMSDGSVAMTGDFDGDGNKLLNISAVELINSEDNTLSLRLPATGVADYQIVFPSQLGSEGDVLVLNSAGELEWTELDTGEIESGDIAAGAIDDSHISATAEIAQSKIAGLEDDLDATLLIDGTRAMTNDLNLGTNSIINVDTVDGVNLSDLESDVSANETAIATKQDDLEIPGDATQYLDGDGMWRTLDPTAVGLENVDNIQQMPLSYLDTDVTLGNDNEKVPSQNAVKTYVDDLINNSISDASEDYLLLDGTQMMIGDLNIGENQIFFHSDTANNVGIRAPSSLTSNYTLTLPENNGASGEVLSSDGAGNLQWIEELSPGGSAGGDLTGNYPNPDIANSAIENIHISADANIDANKIATGLVNNTEFNYLSGASSSIQDQLDAKEEDLGTGTANQYLDENKQWQDLDTDAVIEGANLYFTNQRAQSAVIDDSIANGETDRAPSQNAVYGALELKADSSDLSDYVLKDGDTMDGALELPANGLTVGTNQLTSVDGNIGVGVSAPQEALHVEGNIRAGNTTHRHYSPMLIEEAHLTSSDTYWILTEFGAGNNEISGKFYGQRSSGNYSARNIEVIYSSADDNDTYRAYLEANIADQFEEEWSLVKLTHQDVDYVALRLQASNDYTISRFYFDGYVASDNHENVFKNVEPDDVSDVENLDFEGSKKIISANTEIKGSLIHGGGGIGTVTKNVVSYFTSDSSATEYIHLRLPFNVYDGSNMYHIKVTGYAYGASQVLDLTYVGYSYAVTNDIRNTHSFDPVGSFSPTQYVGSDNNVYLRFKPSNVYFLTFTVDSMYVGNGRVIEPGEISVIKTTATTL